MIQHTLAVASGLYLLPGVCSSSYQMFLRHLPDRHLLPLGGWVLDFLDAFPIVYLYTLEALGIPIWFFSPRRDSTPIGCRHRQDSYCILGRLWWQLFIPDCVTTLDSASPLSWLRHHSRDSVTTAGPMWLLFLPSLRYFILQYLDKAIHGIGGNRATSQTTPSQWSTTPPPPGLQKTLAISQSLRTVKLLPSKKNLSLFLKLERS